MEKKNILRLFVVAVFVFVFSFFFLSKLIINKEVENNMQLTKIAGFSLSGELIEINNYNSKMHIFIIQIEESLHKVVLEQPIKNVFYVKDHHLFDGNYEDIKQGNWVYISWQSYNLPIPLKFEEIPDNTIAKVDQIWYAEESEDMSYINPREGEQ